LDEELAAELVKAPKRKLETKARSINKKICKKLEF